MRETMVTMLFNTIWYRLPFMAGIVTGLELRPAKGQGKPRFETAIPFGPMEDEAVLDRGASFLKHVCDEEEVEGHHTIYIGVHVPKSYRRRRRHKRKAGHKEKKEKERISENYSDKSDVENADESSSSILKPLNIFYSSVNNNTVYIKKRDRAT
ncbi:electrogenic sodium bicarbonate cotransporter 1 isoform b [Cricetulus griseus]|nr:electrogenic sodium bicarbonate cotransporter 1 isoform b [Cricetulus griseus]